MFDADLQLDYIDGRLWRLLEPFSYKPMHPPPAGGINVPKGFVTDFASVPKIFQNIFPTTGSYGKAAVIHDYLYQTNGLTRARADEIFLEAMTELGVGWMTRHTLYTAVRVGGWMPWKHYRELETTAH